MESGTAEPDHSLVRRRQRLEISAAVARGVGIVATMASVASWAADSTAAGAEIRVAVGYAVIAVMAAATAVSVMAYRRAAGAGYARLRALEFVLDGMVITGAVVSFAAVNQSTTWPLLVVPILVSSFQSRTVGAVAMWAFTTTCYGVGLWILTDRIPPELPMLGALHFIIAVVAGTQGAAYGRQVEELNKVRTVLRHQAAHDSLTGLANRAHVAERAAAHTGEQLAVLLLDLNHFKQVNDTLGHAAGDELLRVVADRLVAGVRDDDVVGRLGGDEFVVLLVGADAAAARKVSDQIRRSLARPIDLGGTQLPVQASIGIAVRHAGASTDLETLTAEADAVMYAEKETVHRHAGPAAAPAGVATATGTDPSAGRSLEASGAT